MAGLLAERLVALRLGLGEELREAHEGRRTALLGRPDRHRLGPRAFDHEAHDLLVDRADLLDVEGPIGEPLAVQHEELLEHAVDVAVGHGGQRAGKGRRPAFEDREALGVEERPAPGDEADLVPAAATAPTAVHEAEEDEELGPGAEAVLHRFGKARVILLEPGEEPAHRVGLLVDRARRHEAALLGIEQEDEPHHHRDERLGDFGLALATLAQEARKAPLRRPGADVRIAEQRPHRGEDRPSRHAEHVGEDEIEMARGLAPGHVEEAEPTGCDEEADRDPGLAQQPLEPRVRRGVPAVRGVLPGPVDRGVVGLDLHEGQPARGFALGRGDRAVGAQGHLELAQMPVELDRRLDECRLRPPEDLAEDRERLRSMPLVVHEGGEPVAPGLDLLGPQLQPHLAVGEHVGREDEPHRLDEAQPFAVPLDRGVGRAQGSTSTAPAGQR